MSPKALLEPILENGIKNTYFFEGRLLSGRDLQDQQIANRACHLQLGRAIGAGVIEGLEVDVKSDGADGSSPQLTVKAGLALTAKGDILELPQHENISLTRTLEAIAGTGNLFFNCLKPPTASIPNGAGIYILVMSPASGFRERAPKSGLNDDGIVKGCGSRYIVEGVQFRLVELNPANLDSITPNTRDNLLLGDLLSAGNPASVSEPARLSKLRNILAHLCFGTETLLKFSVDPFAVENGQSAYINYTALDDLHQLELLDDCDVPLAMLYWTLDGIAFLDLWSVRRRPFEMTPSALWPTLISPRRLAEAEARFLQFQLQLRKLVQDHSNPRSIKAEEYFYYLPPAGFLNLRIGTSDGLVPDTFFDLLPHRSAPEFNGTYDEFIDKSPQFVDGSLVDVIVIESLRYQPITLPQTKNQALPEELPKREMVWLYYPWQQIFSIKQGEELEHYLLFTVAYMPPFGNARFDAARWDFSNYARSCK